MTKKIAINGFGRIGRAVCKYLFKRNLFDNLDLVAINDLTSVDNLAYLLKYDSVFGIFDHKIEVVGDSLVIDGKKIKVLAEPDPSELPWKELGVDIVLECSGRFRSKDKAQLHINAGAKKVLISAPGKNVDITIVKGVNDKKYNPNIHHIISNASCTTNALAPVAYVLDKEIGIKAALMTTVHSYTNDQKVLDVPHSKDVKRGRAAALSMIPTTTGAAKATGLVVESLAGKMSGLAIRVPTPNVSLVDLVVLLDKEYDKEYINSIFEKYSNNELKNILTCNYEPLVSRDFLDNTHSAIVDCTLTMVSGPLVKVFVWYDNEIGYSNRMLDVAMIL